MFNLLNLILLTFSAELNSLNHHLLTDYLVFSLFLKTTSKQSSFFNLIVFKEYTLIKLYLTSCFVVDLSL